MHRQHDAQEFLSALMDAFYMEMVEPPEYVSSSCEMQDTHGKYTTVKPLNII